MRPIFLTGIGTSIGKTLIAAILIEAMDLDYWKPVQAGYEDGTDSEWIRNNITRKECRIHPELYKLRMPVSPHIAAKSENLHISIDEIAIRARDFISENKPLLIEGAGGLLVPLNENEFVIDLIKKLNARVILVSRNYLGSINHSLLTAAICKQHALDVVGWIFNDRFGSYEQEISEWSGYPVIASIPPAESPYKEFISKQSMELSASLKSFI